MSTVVTFSEIVFSSASRYRSIKYSWQNKQAPFRMPSIVDACRKIKSWRRLFGLWHDYVRQFGQTIRHKHSRMEKLFWKQTNNSQTIYLDNQFNNGNVIQLLWLLLVQMLFAVVIQFGHLGRFLFKDRKGCNLAIKLELWWFCWLSNQMIANVEGKWKQIRQLKGDPTNYVERARPTKWAPIARFFSINFQLLIFFFCAPREQAHTASSSAQALL